MEELLDVYRSASAKLALSRASDVRYSGRSVEIVRRRITENAVQTNGYCILHVERPQGKVSVIAATSEWLREETSGIIPPYRISFNNNKVHIGLIRTRFSTAGEFRIQI